ncbi:MAG TPA: LuxR C-terminal-related transcriptional regulator [Actinokineospora sp.]|jgi:DNA-binding NarL/FixJ family response regulator|nr:LuxR C-terminal-related transcriptional regulator [Actinokineospora sp.]
MRGVDPAVPDLVAAGERAMSEGAWDLARGRFEAALATETTAAALDGLARALWWLDRPAEAIDARIRAYALFRRATDLPSAVRIALWLAHEYSAVHGNEPAAEGWLARAEHLLADQADIAELGYLDLAVAERCLDPAVAAEHAESALALARRLADPDLELAALSRAGLANITLGQVDKGLRYLDQAMAAATGEDAATYEAVARTCCSLVLACDIAGDADRVRQWGKVVAGYVHRHDELPLLTFCPTCDADMLGDGEAEAELVHALASLANSGTRSRCVDPAVRLSQLRIRQGRIEEAEETLVGYGGSPAAVRADAAIRLARGDAEAAVALLERQLSVLNRSGLLAVPLLAQLVEARLAAGDPDGAAATAAELAGLASRTGNTRVSAVATAAAGRVALATATSDAAELLRHGVELFGRSRMPYEQARTQLELASALRGGALAAVEAQAAFRTFERLGARHDADRADALLRELGVRGRTGRKDAGLLTEREQEVLRLLARGLTNREIGGRLFLSAKTVEHHVGAILRKLGVKTRTEAAAALPRMTGGE